MNIKKNTVSVRNLTVGQVVTVYGHTAPVTAIREDHRKAGIWFKQEGRAETHRWYREAVTVP